MDIPGVMRPAARRENTRAQWMYDAKGNVDKGHLVETYALLVKRIAYQLMSRLPASVDVDDLIQNGMIGLLDAIGRYEDGLGRSSRLMQCSVCVVPCSTACAKMTGCRAA